MRRLARLGQLHKALEAENRLNFISDVSMLFAKDIKTHTGTLVKQALMDNAPKKPKVQNTANGKFVCNSSYIVED